MDILNSLISQFVTSIDSSKAPFSSNIIRLHGFCSLFSVVGMKRIMRTGDILVASGDTHIIIVLSQINVSMKVKP